MNDPESMSVEEAAELLGVSREASAPVVERAYAEKLEALEKKIAQAPTAALKNKYRLSIDRLKAAREVLASQDTGSDLPSLDVSREEDTPPRAPEAAAKVSAAPAEAPASKAPGKSKTPLIIGGIAAVGIIGFLVSWFGFPPATAKWAGAYRNQVVYSDAIYNYDVQLSRAGVLTGTNQSADGTGKANTLTGSINEKGEFAATGSDGVTYSGTMDGDQIVVTEKLKTSNVVFKLKKDFVLPKEAPQAAWAGVYHEFNLGSWMEAEVTVEPNGNWKRKLVVKNKSIDGGKGTINTKGKITGKTSDDFPVTGSIVGDALELTEKDDRPGKTYEYSYKLTKGRKTAPTTAKYGGVYHTPNLEFGYSYKEFKFTVAANGSVTGYEEILGQTDSRIEYEGSVDGSGKFSVKSRLTPSTVTGSIQDSTLTALKKYNENETDKDGLKMVLTKGEKPAPSPFYYHAGSYVLRKVYDTSVYDFYLIVKADGSLTGTNRLADGSRPAIKVTGTVSESGSVSATGSDKTVYTGTVKDKFMTLDESVPNQNHTIKLVLSKSDILPSTAPQAAFAGTYTATLLQPGEVNAIFTITINAKGEVTGTRHEGSEADDITGSASTVGKLDLKVRRLDYSLTGAVTADKSALQLIEKSGDSVINDTFRLTKQ